MLHSLAPDLVGAQYAAPEGFHGGVSEGQLLLAHAFVQIDAVTALLNAKSNCCSSALHPAAVNGLP